MITETEFPIAQLFMTDIAVIAVMACKAPCYMIPFRNVSHKLACILLWRSVWDRIVLTLFPVTWLIYVANISGYLRWNLLFWIFVAQLLAAGAEAYLDFVQGRSAKTPRTPPDSSSGLEYAMVGRAAGGG